MKKYMIVVIACLLFLLVGCGNKNNKVNDNKINNEKVYLYSNANQLVFDSNGTYKMLFKFENEKVTSYEHYYEEKDAKSASEKAKELKEKYKDYVTYKDIVQKGNYYVFVMAESEYENMTYDEVQNKYSYLVAVYEDKK